MENLKEFNVIFESDELNNIIKGFNSYYKLDQNNFAILCYYVFKLKEFFNNSVIKYKRNCYYGMLSNKRRESYSYGSILKNLGIQEKTATRLISCYDKFVNKTDTGVPKLEDTFFPFSKSKLYVMLPMAKENLIYHINHNNIRPEMTKNEISNFIKTLKAEETKKQVIEENNNVEIPEVFDIKNNYEFSYFEKLTKDDLIDICWQLYNKVKNKTIKT